MNIYEIPLPPIEVDQTLIRDTLDIRDRNRAKIFGSYCELKKQGVYVHLAIHCIKAYGSFEDYEWMIKKLENENHS